MTARSIKTPYTDSKIFEVTDIFDLIAQDPNEPGIRQSDGNLVPVKVRSALTTTDIVGPQPRLWTRRPTNCTLTSARFCKYGTTNLDTLPTLLNESYDPFIAQLPSGYNTGLIRQFLPRINSSVTRVNAATGEFPPDCQDLPGSFYARYAYTSGPEASDYNWSITACMPANQTNSSWTSSSARQDISEVLYLNLSIQGLQVGEAQGSYRISANTSIGYFELPNYMNNLLPGPLLDKDPVEVCGHDCVPQGFRYVAVILVVKPRLSLLISCLGAPRHSLKDRPWIIRPFLTR